MGRQDLEADLNRCKQMQEAAAKCYWESKFDQSEELYRAALAVLETVYATDSANISSCLQGLGDSYYFQDKFGLALPYYKRLLASRERMADTDASDYITALFKLAKTYDKLGEFDECEQTYKRATATAQKRLFLGHPLLTSLLEAYGKFLKRVKPGTEHGIEQQATLSREKYVDPDKLAAKILEAVGGDNSNSPVVTTASGKKNKIWFSKSVSEDSNHWFVKFLLALKGSPAKTFAFLFSPLILAFLFFVGSVTYELIVDESPQNAIVADGQVFQTADGHQRVSFTKRGAAIEQSGVSVNRPYQLLGNRWRELLFVFNNGGSEPWTLKKEKNLVTESGVTLLPASDPTTKLIPIMAKLADQLYAKVNNTNPKEFRSIKLDPYTNPVTGLYAVPILTIINTDMRMTTLDVDATPDSATAFDAAGQEKFKSKINNATKYSDIDHRTLPGSTKPGAILCLLSYAPAKPTDVRFYVLGVGENDQFVQSCQSGSPLYFYGGVGIGTTMSCPGAEPISETRIILARRTKESLADSRRLLGWDLILLVPFLICTAALQAQFSAKQLSERAVHSKIAMLQLAVLLYMPFAFAYMFFTLFVIAKAFD
ncbi:hypothetical protein BH10CYA1_BH10CYA1_10880 [soil metagenome]